MAIFWPIFVFKNVPKYLFYSVFWTSPKICPKKGPKKTITFHNFENTGWLKNRFVAICFETKNLYVAQKT